MSKQSKKLKELADRSYHMPGEVSRWIYAVEEMSELNKEIMKELRKGAVRPTDEIIDEACDTILTVWMMLDNWKIGKKEIMDRMVEKLEWRIMNDHLKPYPTPPRYPVTIGQNCCDWNVSMVGGGESEKEEDA